jgi:AAA family ATP:ADP antiporter
MQILTAYFVVLPLRDEGAISLGLGALPGLFAGSLVLTVLAAPVASLVFSLPSIPKTKVRTFLSSNFELVQHSHYTKHTLFDHGRAKSCLAFVRT